MNLIRLRKDMVIPCYRASADGSSFTFLNSKLSTGSVITITKLISGTIYLVYNDTSIGRSHHPFILLDDGSVHYLHFDWEILE